MFYEVIELIGAGGMGEVYRARDARLNRDVALKTLPALRALDPVRLLRFKREAQVLASLNHTNIAAIYGLEESGATPALVLELVEGPTLAARIAPFDVAQRTFTGGAVPVAGFVMRSAGRLTGAASFSVSSSSLIYVTGLQASPTIADYEVRLTDRQGKFERLKLPIARYSTPRVSPDGTRLALGVQDGNEARIALYELSGASALRRLTLKGNNRFPIWSRDSKRLTFQSDRDGDLALFQTPVDGGTVERLTKPAAGETHEPEEWSPVSDTLLFSVTKNRDVALWTFSQPGGKLAPFGNVHSSFPTGARFSRDGRWVAYAVRAGERPRIYVQAFPPTGEPHELLISGINIAAHKVAWSADSNELFYIPRIQEFEAVRFTTHPTFKFSDPRKLPRPFESLGALNMRTQYDVTPAGKFVGLFPPGESGSTEPPMNQINVVLNWVEELKARR